VNFQPRSSFTIGRKLGLTPRTSYLNLCRTAGNSSPLPCRSRFFRYLRGVMIVVVDERQLVIDGYTAMFSREGISATGLSPHDFADWMQNVSANELGAIEAVLLGECDERDHWPQKIRQHCDVPVIAVLDSNSLDQTLTLFRAGVDDVLRKPVHVREILARIAAIRRRGDNSSRHDTAITVGPICVFNDGRDPQIGDQEIALPRRERRILEYLVANRGRRVSKTQIFNSIYGVFDAEIEENVIESHISKLRKKLKHRIGHDVIDSKRFLGYRLAI